MGNMAATRTKTKDLLNGVGGAVSKLGMFFPDDSETDECFGIATVAEPLIVIGPGKMNAIESMLQGGVTKAVMDFGFKVRLYFAYENHTDFDYTALEDLIEEILGVLTNMANWDGVLVSSPYEIEPFEKTGEHTASPRVVLMEMGLRFKGNV